MADDANKNYQQVQSIARQVEKQLPKNRELLTKVKQHGFQKI